MTYTNRSAIIRVALISTSLLSAAAVPIRADSTWIDPSDPTGLGTDPSPGSHLIGNYTDINHWSPSAVPATTANLNFNAPGYDSTPYNVDFSANQTANKATIANPVTFNLSNRTFTLSSTVNSFNDVSLLVTSQKQLTVKTGTLKTQGVQLGASTSASTGPASLTVNGITAVLQVGGNIANYQTLTAIGSGTIRLGNNVVLNQAPDLSLGGFNTGLTLLDSLGSIHFANNVTVRGGTLRATNGAQIVMAGTSLTFDSLYYDYDLGVGGEDFTMNIASTLLDPHSGSAVIPTTVTGAIFVDGSTFNVNHALLLLTADGGTTWNAAGTAGDAHLNIVSSTVTSGSILFDGDPAAGAGSHTVVDSSVMALHGDMFVGDAGHADFLETGTNSSVVVDGTIYIDDGQGGSGTVTIDASNSLSATTAANIGASGILNMQGGTFTTPTIALTGILKGNGNVFGTITGTGTVEADSPGTLTTDSIRANSLVVNANASHVIRTNSAYSKLNTLTLAHSNTGTAATYTSVLQLNNNHLILQSTDPTDKAAKILAINEALFAGHNGTNQTWSAAQGITSATVAADPTHLTLAIYDNAALHSLTLPGQPRTDWAGGTANVDTNSILITPALKGDINLDGLVNVSDLILIAAHFNEIGLSNGISTLDMTQGDVNQDGIVNVSDLILTAANFNATSPFNLTTDFAPLVPNPIPEPATLLLLAAPFLLGSRRSSSHSRKKHLPT